MPDGERGSPAERVSEAISRWGDEDVIRRCVNSLVPPRRPLTGTELELAMVLGGLSDAGWLSAGKPPGNGYWARV